MRSDDNVDAVVRRATRNTDTMVTNLQKMIRQPSVSAKNEGLEQCATLVSDMLADIGLESRLLYLKKYAHAPPVIYAEILSKSNPDKTVLFYNHYDVQPAEPFDLWTYPAFDGVRRGNKVYGRGSTDDKGEIAARMHAISSYIQETGDVPCNVKFLIEGEEEIGSMHLPKYLYKYKRQMACDGVIWEFGYVSSDGRPIIGLGMKGLMFVELEARGPSRDAHSSLAVLIENPAWRLVGALGTMRSPDGNITIKGWNDHTVDFTPFDLRLLRKEPFDDDMFKKEFKIEKFACGIRGSLAAKKALAGFPTCNIAGMTSGYVGSGAKTVLPAKATAKIDFRLVPGMDPDRQFEILQRHLKSHGYEDVRARMIHKEAAARTDPTDTFVKNVTRAAQLSFCAKPIINVSNAGTGPMHAVSAALRVPCVSVGSTYLYSRMHSPNEFARVDLLKKTAHCMCRIMANLGST